MVPPFEKHALADQLEPRCEFKALILEHGLEVLLAHIARVSDLVGAGIEVHIRLEEENIVDCIRLSAHASNSFLRGRVIMTLTLSAL